MILHIIIDALRNAILITGLVVVMMMLIESFNIESKGLFFKGLRRSKFGQVLFSSILGVIPGCMGGFAAVSLYTHRLLSFGALVAMMIASTGDEAFVIMAMMPDQAIPLFLGLFALSIPVGLLTDFIYDRISKGPRFKPENNIEMTEPVHEHGHNEGHGHAFDEGHGHSIEHGCEHGYEVHEETDKKRSFSWLRVAMFAGVAIFIAALVTGSLDHEHDTDAHEHATEIVHEADANSLIASDANSAAEHQQFTINLLDETWMQYLFAVLSLIVLGALIFASDHFVKEHLWKHIVKKHLLSIFAWTFGVLLLISVGLQFIDISSWISDNTALMILLAAAIGMIPESGPHLIFVTLYAGGLIPLPVLLASSISQDGHAALPLLAESKKSFAWAKLINFAVALAVGYAAMLF